MKLITYNIVKQTSTANANANVNINEKKCHSLWRVLHYEYPSFVWNKIIVKKNRRDEGR